MIYDPERELWVPNRRSFLFMTGAAMAGTMLLGAATSTVIRREWSGPVIRVKLPVRFESRTQVLYKGVWVTSDFVDESLPSRTVNLYSII